jgi:2'-5' RNA ligase
MRCFIAVNLDDSMKREIGSVITGLKSGNWDVKWVPAENLHITLKFLGETSEDLAERIKRELAVISGRYGHLDLSFRGVGVFPDRKRPRVVWIDLFYPEELRRLQEEVEQILSTIGFEREDRPFSPHLTIGRIRSSRGKDFLLNAMEALKDKDFGNIRADRISLMKSDLKPTGAQYSVVAEFPLTKEEQ